MALQSNEEERMSNKPVVVNCDIYWASLSEPNHMSGKYQVDLCNLSDGAVDALAVIGVEARSKGDEKGNFITAKSKNPIKAMHSSGDYVDVPVGNGSKAKVVLSSYPWTSPTGQKGTSASIMKLIITELEVFESVEMTDVNLEEAL